MIHDQLKEMLPNDVLEKALIIDDELAWTATDAFVVIDYCLRSAILVVGGELWYRSGDNPIMPNEVFGWSIDDMRNDETWDVYINRAGVLAKNEITRFVETISHEMKYPPEPYFDLVFEREDEQ